MPVLAQLSGTNLLEYQLGNLPETEPGGLSAHYDQLNLAYTYKSLKIGMRYEHFLSQTEGSSYYRLSQARLRYRLEGLELKVGSLTETLGNGLLVRGFEIPGSVFEDQAYRTRYGFYRDLLGFSARYSANLWYVQVLRGKSLVNVLPPTFEPEERRVDLVEAVEGGINLLGQSVGMILMRNSNIFSEDYYYSLLFSGSALGALTYNLEYAHGIDSELPLLAMDDLASFGLYASLGFSIGPAGFSAEYKDYHNMLIGTGINDPPTVVREQKYKVLNRSIHVPQLLDESGFQMEAYYSFPSGQMLVVNYTRAVNDLFRRTVFTEAFAEFTFYPGDRSGFSLFADFTSDEFKAEDLRYAGGVIWDRSFARRWSTQLHLEYQYIERRLSQDYGIHNAVFIAGLSRSPDFSISLVIESSNDPYLATNEEGAVYFRYWPGMEMSYKINHSNTLSLFAGKRRGGPACTSGICYEVLDFEGVELRLRTKF